MASWADEFDIDDSDILGALQNRRKEPSQLASPPWPPAAADPRPPQVPLMSSSADPHHPFPSSAGLLKRFQRPRVSQNGASMSEDVASIAFNSQKKRKNDSDLAPTLPYKEACRLDATSDGAIRGDDLSPSFPSHSQIHGAFASKDTLTQHCHPLSSYGIFPSRATASNSECLPKHAHPENEELASSQQPLRDIEQNVHLGHTRTAPSARRSLKQNSGLDIAQQRMTYIAQTQENTVDERSKGIANVPQQECNRVNDVQPDASNQPLRSHASTSMRKFMSGVPLDTDHRKNVEQLGSRGVRFLPKDLHYSIPGPAGAVQRGLGQNRNTFSGNNRMKQNIPTSGQASVSDDADFQSEVWRTAENYVEKSSIPICNISSLKTSRTENRISKLLAVIKSCVPNGCGDATVCLKDQTDSIYGIVNRRVISETEFGRIIEPGAVILLNQVAVFSPTPYAHYLNITITNVEQVFAKGSGFFKGECSKAASRAVRDMTEDEEIDDADNPPTRPKCRMGDFNAQTPGDNGHSKVRELLEEEDELETLLAQTPHQRTPHQTTHHPVCDETQLPAAQEAVLAGRASHGRGGQPDTPTPMRDQIDELSSDRADDGYDQLLDDTDLFTCIQTKSGLV